MPKTYKLQRISPKILKSAVYRGASLEDRGVIDEIILLQNTPVAYESLYIEYELKCNSLPKRYSQKQLQKLQSKYPQLTGEIEDAFKEKDKKLSKLVCKIPELIIGFDCGDHLAPFFKRGGPQKYPQISLANCYN